MATKYQYPIIKARTTSDFKQKVKEYCKATDKKESQVIHEALRKLIDGR